MLKRNFYFLTYTLSFLILVVYILEVLCILNTKSNLLVYYGGRWNEKIVLGEYWRFITYSLIHGNLIHLLFNLYALNIICKGLEKNFGIFRSIIVFIITTWYSGLISFLFSPSTISIGISGFIFGAIGSLTIYYYKLKSIVKNADLKFKEMYTLAIINFLIGLLIPNIDNYGHIGGYIAGCISSYFLSPTYGIVLNEANNSVFLNERRNSISIAWGLIILFLTYVLTKKAISLSIQIN